MALQLDETGKIMFRGKVVGEVIRAKDKQIVRLELEFGDDEEWVVPINWLAVGLSIHERTLRGPSDLVATYDEESVEPVPGEPQTLLEFIVKQRNYIWEFHKNDEDKWPSELHAHEYERGLILDALTGRIYDKTTRKHIRTMKPKRLEEIHQELRDSKDFKGKVERLLEGS